MPFNLINFEEQLLRYLESTDSNLINKMFIKDDVYSHLTDEMYVNYYLPYILKNTAKD